MSSPENNRALSGEKTWSYHTPYDLVDRAKVIADEGEHSQRAIDIDTYMDHLNNGMPDGYMIITRMDREGWNFDKSEKTEGSRIFKQNEQSEYEWFASLIT